MSERELRKELPLHLCPDEDGEHCPYCERAWGLLTADPDVVAVAREFPELRGYIERAFHVRLTDKGWEWTDDLTAAEAFAPEIEQSGDREWTEEATDE